MSPPRVYFTREPLRHGSFTGQIPFGGSNDLYFLFARAVSEQILNCSSLRVWQTMEKRV